MEEEIIPENSLEYKYLINIASIFCKKIIIEKHPIKGNESKKNIFNIRYKIIINKF